MYSTKPRLASTVYRGRFALYKAEACLHCQTVDAIHFDLILVFT